MHSKSVIGFRSSSLSVLSGFSAACSSALDEPDSEPESEAESDGTTTLVPRVKCAAVIF